MPDAPHIPPDLLEKAAGLGLDAECIIRRALKSAIRDAEDLCRLRLLMEEYGGGPDRIK